MGKSKLKLNTSMGNETVRYDEGCTLESIIKTEAECFQDSQAGSKVLRVVVYDALQPVVELERLNIQANGFVVIKTETSLTDESLVSPSKSPNADKSLINKICDLCPRKFRFKFAIKDHIRKSHLKLKPYACKICDFRTTTKTNLREHVRRHDEKKRCEICQKWVATLKKHMKLVHMDQYRKPCPICGKIYGNSKIKRHIKAVHDHQDRPRKFKCLECNESFVYQNHLRIHNLKAHPKGEVFECHCGAVYKSLGCLIAHKTTHKWKLYDCGACNRTGLNRRQLRTHWRKEHFQALGAFKLDPETYINRQKGPFICDICGKTTKTRDVIYKHLCLHLKPPRLACDLCPKRFNNKAYIENHMNGEHMPEKPFACDICETRCISEKYLMNHKKIHAGKSKCPVCKKKVSVLDSHLKQVHYVTTAMTTCHICNLTFLNRIFKLHLQRVHFEIKCRFCDEVFSSAADKIRHLLRDHRDGRKLFCDLCPETFHNKFGIEKHLRHHIPRRPDLKFSSCKLCGFKTADSSIYARHRAAHKQSSS